MKNQTIVFVKLDFNRKFLNKLSRSIFCYIDLLTEI